MLGFIYPKLLYNLIEDLSIWFLAMSRQKLLHLLQRDFSRVLRKFRKWSLDRSFHRSCSAIVYAQHNEREDSSSAERKTAKLKDSCTEISTGPDNLEITDSREVIARDFLRPLLLTCRIIFLKTSNYISLSSEIGCKTKFRIRKDPKWTLVFVTLWRKHYWHFDEEKSVTDR